MPGKKKKVTGLVTRSYKLYQKYTSYMLIIFDGTV